ncbi:DEAD/DEAH box helicase [Candidatus Woesearchaeota archaeon]|nr:MAG: DEAD/DEAH box helicase [Candidatus Woesearchaeota archaeon]
MDYKGLKLDSFQEDAIRAIEANKSVVVSAPTGSGKTLIADYIIDRDIKKGVKVIYTAPIKALSNQKYKDFCRDYGKDNIGLLTGDVVKNPGASVLIMTTEIYRNMCVSRDPLIDEVSYVIFDEIHYINDPERGYVWEESIIFSKPHVRMLCLSATIPNAREFASWIQDIKGHDVVVVRHSKRPVPLKVGFYDYELGLTTLDEIKSVADIPDIKYLKGKKRRRRPFVPSPVHTDLVQEIADKTPCMFFTFSRAGTQRNAVELSKLKLFPQSSEVVSYVREKLGKAPSDISRLESAKVLRSILPQGIAFHHAGLLPVLKDIVEELFSRGLIRVLYTTETFAVGINMPAKTVCFESLRKFDGREFRLLNSKEFFQIAGRAGRRGIDKEGFVVAMIARRDFEYDKIKRLTSSDTAPIRSQFRLSVNTVLNLIKQYDDNEIRNILTQSFFAYQSKKRGGKEDRMQFTFDKIKKRLVKLGYVDGKALTPKGEFTSRIYADELLFGEAFATDFYESLTEYQMFLLISAICYEGRERTMFYKVYPSKEVSHLKALVRKNPVMRRYKRFENLDVLTGLVRPCYDGKSIFDVFDNTNLLEGDVMRFFRQVVDRMGQVRTATQDRQLAERMAGLQDRILGCLSQVEEI